MRTESIRFFLVAFHLSMITVGAPMVAVWTKDPGWTLALVAWSWAILDNKVVTGK